MKTIRYLLFTIAVLLSIHAGAVTFGDMPAIGFYSTSAMPYSGSSLPNAAITGAYEAVSPSLATTSTSAQGNVAMAGMRRVSKGDPYAQSPVPVGDTPWVLVLLFTLGWGLINGGKLGRRENLRNNIPL